MAEEERLAAMRRDAAEELTELLSVARAFVDAFEVVRKQEYDFGMIEAEHPTMMERYEALRRLCNADRIKLRKEEE